MSGKHSTALVLKPPNTAKPNTTPSRRIPPVILRNVKKKADEAWKEKKKVFVDHDGGNHNVSVQLSGIRTADLPQHIRVRVAGKDSRRTGLSVKWFRGFWGLSIGRISRDCSIGGCKPDAETFNALINVHGRAGQWRWAMNIKDDMLRAAGQRGAIGGDRHRGSSEWCDGGGSGDVLSGGGDVVWRCTMMWCDDAHCGIVGDAEVVWWTGVMGREMVVVGMVWRVRYLGHEGSIVSGVVMLIVIPPSRSTYNDLINVCGSSGNWRQALQVCQMMTENGVGPDLVTHNIVLSAFKSGAQYLKAVS
ncbi:hypothetical protein RHMOL_Rhmol07G0064800 [Rhododendron molle]|uniref:Uncharacterized protein n=1 Tax=Rhododendron molle TaxID=49168 RepID=A0ACC0MXR8_RHOML|nr:hypothetical protein RHMOL_Rhmol07G0064800 [Rhododendron molle]